MTKYKNNDVDVEKIPLKNIEIESIDTSDKRKNYLKDDPFDDDEDSHEMKRSIDENNSSKIWELPISKRLREYSQNSYELSWKHDIDANYYNSLNTKLTVISTLLSAISAVAITGLLSLFSNDNDDINNTKINEIYMYIISISTILVNLIVAGINSYKYIHNFVYKIIECSDKSSKFSKLYNKIKNQFCLPISERYNAKTFLDYVFERYSELDREKPFIRDSTNKKWDKYIKNKKHIHENFTNLPYEFKDLEKQASDIFIGDSHGNIISEKNFKE